MSTNETVLVIDNRRGNVTFLVDRVLQPAGYNVSVAYNGEQGYQKALEEKPALIIMDINVPDMSGPDVLRALRQAEVEIPVILMTFHGSEEAAVQAFRLGAKDYIVKPYQPEDMGRAIERALAEGRLRRERDQLANSIAQANRQVERQLKELNILSSIGKSVTALLDEDRLLTRVVEAAVYVTNAEEGFLLLADEESGELIMRAARGLGEKYARGLRFKVDDSLAGEVLRTGKPVIVTGSRREDRFKVKTGYLVKSLLHVPLRVGDAVIGVLSVDHMIEDRTFSNHDLYLLSSLADYAAIALENSRLHARLQARLEQQLPGSSMLPPAQPGAAKGASDLTGDVQARREEIQARLQAGGEILSGLREQIASLEVWLDGMTLQEQSLIQVGSAPSPDKLPALAPLTQELDAILDSMVDGVLVVDQNDRIVIVNYVAAATLGNHLVGVMVDNACDDPRWAKTYRIVKAAAQLEDSAPGSEIVSATTPLIIAQKRFYASFRVKSSVGQVPNGIVIVLRDITAEREAQRAKDSLVASISQELRTPATSIVGYADLLMGESIGSLGEMQRKFLDRIRANAERIGVQLNDLLGMTVIDSGQLEVKAEVIDLVSAIREASDALRARMVERGQTLEMNIEPDLPYVQADPDAVYHVLTNLLQNAHYCSPDNSRIVLCAENIRDGDEDYISVSVTDAGGGIKPEDQKKVFNRFYRSDSPSLPGLGDPGAVLPIIKVLVEAHSGRVWLESVLGVGSTFTIILPICSSAPEAQIHRTAPT